MRLISVIGLCLAISVVAGAKENKENKVKGLPYKGFVGGMMVNSGYVWSGEATFTGSEGTATMRIKGVPLGVGGAVKFQFGNHLRFGGEGHVSNLVYSKKKSHYNMSWGGVIVEAMGTVKKAKLFAGGLVGGGGVRNVTSLDYPGLDYVTDNISYRKYGFVALAPYVGMEYFFNPKIGIIVKADWVFNALKRQDDFASGPKIYVGFMFGHSR